MAIAEGYMTPNLRWGLFLKDHPGAPEPTFMLADTDETGIPADFQFDECGEPVQGFVKCVIHYPDGGIAATGFREIPTKEKRHDGSKHNFIKNAESWMKLCTMALGRALKRAGYPDTTGDLRAFLLYEQRNAEIGRVRAGLAPVEAAPQPKAIEAQSRPTDAPQETPAVAEPQETPQEREVREAVAAAAVADPDADSDEKAGDNEPEPFDDPPAHDEPSVHDPEGLQIPDEYTASPYPAIVQSAAADLEQAEQMALMQWMIEKGFTPARAVKSSAVRSQILAEAARLKLAATQAPPEAPTAGAA